MLWKDPTNDRMVLLTIAEKTFTNFTGVLTDDSLDTSIFDQRNRYYITGYNDDVWTIHLPAQPAFHGLVDLDEIVTDAMSLAGFGPPDLTFVRLQRAADMGLCDRRRHDDPDRRAGDLRHLRLRMVRHRQRLRVQEGRHRRAAVDRRRIRRRPIIVERDQPVMSQDEANIRTPSAVEMQYMSKEGPYKSRPTSFSMTTGVLNSITTPKFSTPILFSDAEAQRIVQEKFFEYQEKRRGHTLIVAPENITLLPGDIVSFPSGTITYIARVEEVGIDLRNMGVEISARDFQTEVETTVTAVQQYRPGLSGGLFRQPVYPPRHAAAQLWRRHRRHLADAVRHAGAARAGAVVRRDAVPRPGRQRIVAIFQQLPHQGVMGVCETVLNPPIDPFALDDASTVTIRRVTQDTTLLVDATEAEVLAGDQQRADRH